MKRIQIKIFLIASFIGVITNSCSNVLDEQPRSTLDPTFFKTETGVLGGLAALYGNMRYIYGSGYYNSYQEVGTDEYTYAQSADSNFKNPDLSGVGIVDSQSSQANILWNHAFPSINTASGIIENGSSIGSISPALLSEAAFFRAYLYFQLVQTFGGVPLDLGAGELKFNTSTTTQSVRNTVPEVYTKAIFPDLISAISQLPDTPRLSGTATKTAARLILAKAYLTYGWWLQNPNNIPTYPASARTDPNGKPASYYFQQAYDIAMSAIANPGPFGLQPTYYDVNLGPNDRNKEDLLFADHTQSDEYYNGASLSYSNGTDQDNDAVWMATPNYTVLQSGGVSSVQREAEQHKGRPYIRMAPTIGAITNTFADKTNDSRYDGTFTTVYRGNWNLAGITSPTLVNANGMSVSPGDAILSFTNTDDDITYPSGAGTNAIGAGTIPGRSDFAIGPNGISRIAYPGLWKLGTYRTDNGTGLGSPNAAVTRPFYYAKFSELYLVAAEAAVKGASGIMTARDLVNVLRARAGKWRFKNNANVTYIADNSAAMIAATPATIDINYILAERSREYFGEGYRWLDLVRTQQWNALASTYKIAGSTYGDHTAVTYTRNIQAFNYLRPIPQNQIDAISSDKEKYKNPGY